MLILTKTLVPFLDSCSSFNQVSKQVGNMYVGIETLLQHFEVREDGFVNKLKENSCDNSVMAKFGYFD